MASGPARGKNAASSEREAREKLDHLVYDYLIFAGATKSASSFQTEMGISDQAKGRFADPPGFLYHWWTLFWDLYCAVPERRDNHESSAEGRQFMEMVHQGQLPHHPTSTNGIHAQTPFQHPPAGAPVEQQVQNPMAPHPMYSQMHAHQPSYSPMPMSPGYMPQAGIRQTRMVQQQQGIPMAPSPGQQVLHSPAMSPGQPQTLNSMQRPVPSSLSLGPPMQQQQYANPSLRHPQAGNGVVPGQGVVPQMNMVMSAGTPTAAPHPGTPTVAMPARSSPAGWQNHMSAHHYNVGPMPETIPLGAHVHDHSMMRLHPGPEAHLQDQPQLLEIQKMKQSLKEEMRHFEKAGMPDAGPTDPYFQNLALEPAHMHPGGPG